MIYRATGDEFIIDFMGEVYQKVGVSYENFDKTLGLCSKKYENEKIIPSVYAENIRADARYLLKLCGMDEAMEVWEIQPEEEILLLILGEEQRKIGTYSAGDMVIHLIEAKKPLCEALVKAVFYSKQNHVSLARALL